MKQRMFVKAGTEANIGANGRIDQERIVNRVGNIIALGREHNAWVDMVVSGAVAIGRTEYERIYQRDATHVSKQALATLGNGILQTAYNVGFAEHGLASGLILVHKQEFQKAKTRKAIKHTDAHLKAHGITSLYNYDDAKDHSELKKVGQKTENDETMRRLAQLFKANAAFFTTNVDGFMAEDQTVLSSVSGSNMDELSRHFFDEQNEGAARLSSGGMRAKLTNAHRVAERGALAYICHADADYRQVMAGQAGTQVVQ